MSEFHALRWSKPTHESFLPIKPNQPAVVRVDWHQPASLVVDDLQQDGVLRVNKATLLAEVESLMHVSDKRYAVVIDDHQQVVGLLQARELHGRHTGAVSQLLQLGWDELSAGYVMQVADRQPVITEQQLAHARIGDIAATMQAAGRDFIWVSKGAAITGVISALNIIACTGESVRLYPKADTFAEVFQALKHPQIRDD